MSTLIAERRLAELEATDSILYTNASGSDIANNQLVLVSGDSGFGFVGVALGAIANGSSGALMIKGKVKLPADAVAMTQGKTAQYVPAAANITIGGTASGTYAVGLITDTIASTAGYVNVDLNFGPQAFKVW